jgi:hypothetical protein
VNIDTLVLLSYANAACTVDGDGDKTSGSPVATRT